MRIAAQRRASDGALLAEGTIAREGVYPYYRRRADGSVEEERVLVTAEALTDRRWLDSLAHSSVILGHYDADGKPRWVQPENVQALAVGSVDGTVQVEVDERGFTRVITRQAIRRADALKAVQNGLIELSPAYRADEIAEPGEHPVFGRYDVRQVGRHTNNHVAVVDQGRGSATAQTDADRTRLHLDGAMVAPLTDSEDNTMNKALLTALLLTAGLAPEVVQPRIDSLDSPEKVTAFLREQKVEGSKLDAIQKGLAALRKDEGENEVEALKGKVAALEAENARLKADMEKAPKADGIHFDGLPAFHAAAVERAMLVEKAKALKVDGAEKLDATQLKRSILEKSGVTLPADAPAARVDGAWDVLSASSSYDGLRLPAGWTPSGPRNDGGPDNAYRADSADNIVAKQLANLRGESAKKE